MDPSVDFNNSDPSAWPSMRLLENSLSAYEFWQAQMRRSVIRQEYWEHWNATASHTGTGRPVDAIIAPCAPYVAPPHGKNTYVVVELIG